MQSCGNSPSKNNKDSTLHFFFFPQMMIHLTKLNPRPGPIPLLPSERDESSLFALNRHLRFNKLFKYNLLHNTASL